MSGQISSRETVWQIYDVIKIYFRVFLFFPYEQKNLGSFDKPYCKKSLGNLTDFSYF